MIKPVKGTAFIIEDKTDSLSDSKSLREHGFQMTDEKNVGVSGIIYEVTNQDPCKECGSFDEFKKGDHVIYSKFLAEQIEYKEDGKLVENLKTIPVSGIFAFI